MQSLYTENVTCCVCILSRFFFLAFMPIGYKVKKNIGYIAKTKKPA